MVTNALLIEDDCAVRQTIVSLLTEDGYEVKAISNATEAKACLKIKKPDVILLDLQLPDGNGLSLIQEIRSCTDAPILIISGRIDTVDKVIGLELGADDYIVKPIHIRELSARIKAHVRRYRRLNIKSVTTDTTQNIANPRIKIGNFILDRLQMQVFNESNQSMELTAREFKLLEAMVMAPRQVHTREQLLNKVRNDNLDISDRAVDVQLLRIRRKLNDNQNSTQMIKAVRGVGYILDCLPEIAA